MFSFVLKALVQERESSSVGTRDTLFFVHCKRGLMSNPHFLKHLKGPSTLHSGARVFNLASSHSEFGLCTHFLNKPDYAQPVPNGKNLAKL